MKLFGIVALKKRIVSRETISRISFPLLHNEQYPPSRPQSFDPRFQIS